MTDANVAKERVEEQVQGASSDEDDDLLDDTSHLEEVPDGSGCTEIWEHLSERRENDGEET